MKKIFLIVLTLGMFSTMNAQFLNFGIKGGLNYNQNGDLQGLSNAIDDIKIGPDQETGYHFGIFSEIKIPIFYIRPELVYTHTESGYYQDEFGSKLSMDKIDVPVLLGIRFLKIASIFAGPSFQYILSTDFENSSIYDNVKDVSYDDFSMGMQVGVGLELGKFGADVRYEAGLTDTQAEFVGDVLDEDNQQSITIDTRPQQIIFSVYYKFK